MVLASQMARPGTTRSNMYARGGARRNRLIAVGGGGLVLLLAAWWLWPNSSSGAESGGGVETQEAGLASGGHDGKPATGEPDTHLASQSQPERQQPRIRNEQRELEPMLPQGIDPGDAPVESPEEDAREAAKAGAPPLTMGEAPRQNNAQADSPVVSTQKESPAASPAKETPAPSPSFVPNDTDAAVAALLERADREITAGQLVQGRATLNEALTHPRVGIAAEQIRTRLAELNALMVFGKTVTKGDPFAGTHVIKSGDRLVFIARNHSIDYRFLAHINGMSNPDQIRLGQNLKVIHGPFHVEIDKSDYRLDVYLGEAGSTQRTYVRSFFIGLGELGSTPTGQFRVRPNSKLENPAWTNPRTGEHYTANDPKNPIGDYWIGLEGTDEQTKLLDGYGIHGTIDPTSIGRQMSMGCVRLYDDDIKLLYGMLVPEKSTVVIRD
ncbi:MAG: L,D-transpeptidase family protein [Phycisphaerales bacterium]|nr:L,D-transpeptidase family protein [Phycisphaerales bacterium]